MSCNIYQVDAKKGIVKSNDVINKTDGGINYDISVLDTIIVYRSSLFNPYKVKEILTDVEFDFGEKTKITSPLGDASTYEFITGKEVLDTFVAYPWYLESQKEVTTDQLKKYIAAHFNVEEYRSQLFAIKANGFKNRMAKELSESTKSEDEQMKDILVKMKRLKRTNFNSMDK